MENPNTVNIKIRAMNNQVSTYGLFLEDGNNYLCPKLRPGEVVAVPNDHAIFNSDAGRHIEITNDPVNREYEFASLAEAKAQNMPIEKAIEAADMIGASLDVSTEIRRQNAEALEKAKADGTYVPERPVVSDAAADRAQGLSPVDGNNAMVRGDENGNAVESAPPSRRRRG